MALNHRMQAAAAAAAAASSKVWQSLQARANPHLKYNP
jgi:hypothetical protein